MTENKTGVWNSIPLVVIRWLLFLPVGLVIIVIAEFLAFLLVGWVLSWAGGCVLVFLLIGGGSFLMGLIRMLGNWSAILAGILCPNPKIGTLTTGIVVLLWAIASVYIAVSDDFSANLIAIVVDVVFTTAVLWGFFVVYNGILDDEL